MTLKSVFMRPGRAVAAGTAITLALLTLSLGALTLRNLQRIHQINAHFARSVEMSAMAGRLEDRLVQTVLSTSEREVSAELRAEVVDILSLEDHADPRTQARLEELDRLLAPGTMLDDARGLHALRLLRAATQAETRARAQNLEQLHRGATLEVDLALGVLAALIVLAVLTVWFVRAWILKPLVDLRGLLTSLAEGDFQAITTERVDPILVPLFENYNYLVTRLQALEAEHRERADSLQSEVRRATQALLDQHRTLASAERLAAVGEMAAGLAHELRNPLAGMLLSLNNLRRDTSDPDRVERLDLLIAELERVTRMLNNYLSEARHAPEPLRQVDLGELVGDLVTLLGYQVPQNVTLQTAVAGKIQCALPKDGIRQVLLNLVINSVEALDGEPGNVCISAVRANGRLVLAVVDDGPGFPGDMLKREIRPFASHRNSGTGLGLSMARRAVEELGGEMRLENRDPRGALVRLTFPCRHA